MRISHIIGHAIPLLENVCYFALKMYIIRKFVVIVFYYIMYEIVYCKRALSHQSLTVTLYSNTITNTLQIEPNPIHTYTIHTNQTSQLYTKINQVMYHVTLIIIQWIAHYKQ